MSTSAIRPAHDPSQWGPAIDEAVHVVQRSGPPPSPPAGAAARPAPRARRRQMPPPVLVGSLATLDGLATDVPDAARALATHFWPGALTLILTAQPSLAWDLGETFGTVALRMPDHPTALALLARTGPMAVSSANRTGSPAAVTAQDAYDQLGASVRVYLDAGDAPGGVASTIVDATGPVLRVVRAGAISLAELNAVAPVEEVPVEPVPADGPGEAELETVAGDQPADPSSEPSTATSPERGDTPG